MSMVQNTASFNGILGIFFRACFLRGYEPVLPASKKFLYLCHAMLNGAKSSNRQSESAMWLFCQRDLALPITGVSELEIPPRNCPYTNDLF